MSVDKAQQGWTFASSRMTRGEQEARLRAAGAESIIHIGKDCPDWRWAVNIVRPGDNVRVIALVMLPTPRGDKLRPTTQASAAVSEIIARGAMLTEVHTNRSTASWRERDKMLEDALRGLRGGGRRLPKGVIPRGRPRKHFSDADIEKARTAWFNRDYATNRIAMRHMPKGISKEMCQRRWGASGRPWVKGKIKPAPDPKNARVYFLRDGRSVKIGHTTTGDLSRFKGLQISTSRNLRLIGMVVGDRKTEQRLHHQFREYHIRGEWFKIEGELAAYLKTVPKPGKS